MKEIVIVSDSEGIFVGEIPGIVLFSLIDTAGANRVTTFDNEDRAKYYTDTWNHKTPIHYAEIEVSRSGSASIEELVEAGLESLLGYLK